MLMGFAHSYIMGVAHAHSYIMLALCLLVICFLSLIVLDYLTPRKIFQKNKYPPLLTYTYTGSYYYHTHTHTTTTN